MVEGQGNRFRALAGLSAAVPVPASSMAGVWRGAGKGARGSAFGYPCAPSGKSMGPMTSFRVALIFLAIAANTVLHALPLLVVALVKALLPSAG